MSDQERTNEPTERRIPIARYNQVAAKVEAAERRIAKLETELTEAEGQDLDALATELDNVKAEAAKERLATMRLRVAVGTGLPLSLMPKLKGDDEAAMTEDALRILSYSVRRQAPDIEGGKPDSPRGVLGSIAAFFRI
jgi:hypothetical protein